MPSRKIAPAGPGTVLFIAANPTQTRFAFAEELHCIEESGLKVSSRWSVGVEEIPRLLDSVAPDVVHVLSPGVDPQRGLMLADPRGRPQYAKAPRFAKAFAGARRRKPRLIVLNTCDSAAYARKLTTQADTAIGMDGVIDDRAAVGFAQRLYRALAAGDSVAAAFAQGRAAVEQLSPAQRDVPKLYGASKNSPDATTIAPRTRSKSVPARPMAKGVKAAAKTSVQCVQLFCSYSHKDAKFRAELEVFLAGLRTQGLVHLWHDRLIQPGADWAREIDENLEHADVILLLVSADFIASRYCMGIELKRALERSSSAAARVIPILVRTCDLEGAPFAKLQWLPTGSKPVKTWRDRDAAWTDVAKGVRKVVSDLVATRSA
jgi:hypothetical protein